MSLKFDEINGHFTRRTIHIFNISRSVLGTRNVSDNVCRENQNTYFMFKTFFFKKSCPFLNNEEICCNTGQATDDNMEHAHCMLDS